MGHLHIGPALYASLVSGERIVSLKAILLILVVVGPECLKYLIARMCVSFSSD